MGQNGEGFLRIRFAPNFETRFLEGSPVFEWLQTSDYKQLQEEIGDVMCMLEILKDGGLVTEEQIQKRMAVKKEKLIEWSLLFSED